MKNFKKWVGKKLRQWLWPNWSYKGEMLNSQGAIVYTFHDEDYPDFFEKKIMLRDRIDLTKNKTKPRQYLYTQHQMVYDHVLKSIMLQSKQQIELRFSAINKSGVPLTKEDIAELYLFVSLFDWKPILYSMNDSLGKSITKEIPPKSLDNTDENPKAKQND